MKKILIALLFCAAMTACKKDDAVAADAAAKPADAAATTDATAAAAASGLPKECDDYINRVKACVAKAGGGAAAAQFETALNAQLGQWKASTDMAASGAACKAANDQFATAAAAMKCE